MKRKELSKETIIELCKGKTATEALVALYYHAFPDWDNIQGIRGYPLVSQDTATFILEQLPDPGGSLWLNKGFSSDETKTLPDWIIDYSRIKELTYINAKQC
jgi:hypothetical protein